MVLYVDRQGASFPIGCTLPRIAGLSSERREVDAKQRVKQPARLEHAVSGISALRK